MPRLASRPDAAPTLTAAALLLLAALAWWLRAPLHAMPLERDEGAYAVIGARLLAGDALYRELFDHKPPLVHLVFALAAAAPGDPVVAVRALATLYLLATGAALFALGQRLYGSLAGVAAVAALFVYGSSRRFQGVTFNSEAVLLLPATVGCLLATQALLEGRARRMLWAGVCVGLAALAKPVGLLLVGPLLLAPLLARWPARRALHAAALAVLGVGAPLALAALALLAQGSLGHAATALIGYNRLYAAESVALGWTPAWLWRIWAPMLALGLPALAGLLLASLPAGEPRPPGWAAAHGLVALWGLALLATALLSLRPYPHYYLAAVPLLALWAGAGAAWLGRRAAVAAALPSLAPAVALALTAALAAPAVDELLPLRQLEPRAQIAALYDWDGPEFFAPAADVAAYVDAWAPPGAPIFVWAAEPQIYYLSGRRPAARFVYDYPVDRLPGARDELLEALRRDPPPVIITYRDVRPIGVYPFLDDHGYLLRATIGGYDIFTRGQGAEP